MNKYRYLWQCIVCGKFIKSRSAVVWHCGKLTQWILGTGTSEYNSEEISVAIRRWKNKERVDLMTSKQVSNTVKIKVSGYVEMPLVDFETIMSYSDPYSGFLRALSMSFTNTDNLTFEIK